MQVHSPPATANQIVAQKENLRGKNDKGKTIIEKKLGGGAGAT